MLTREQFRKTFEDIRNLEEKEEIFNNAIKQMSVDGYCFIFSDAISSLIDLLSAAMGLEARNKDGFNDIEYFCYELDFGRVDFASHAIETPEGKTIDLSSVDKLYDYLIGESLYKEKDKK